MMMMMKTKVSFWIYLWSIVRRSICKRALDLCGDTILLGDEIVAPSYNLFMQMYAKYFHLKMRALIWLFARQQWMWFCRVIILLAMSRGWIVSKSGTITCKNNSKKHAYWIQKWFRMSSTDPHWLVLPTPHFYQFLPNSVQTFYHLWHVLSYCLDFSMRLRNCQILPVQCMVLEVESPIKSHLLPQASLLLCCLCKMWHQMFAAKWIEDRQVIMCCSINLHTK